MKPIILLLAPLSSAKGGIATWTALIQKNIKKFNIYTEVVDTSLNTKLGVYSSGISYKTKVMSHLKILFRVIKNIINNNSIILVYLNSSAGQLGLLKDAFYTFFSNLTNKKIIIHYHCNLKASLNNRIAKILFKYIMKNASQLIVLNEESFIESSKIDSSKVIKIPNFMDSTEISRIKKPITSKTIDHITFIGGVSNFKGANYVISAAKEFREIEFHFIGYINENISPKFAPSNCHFYGEQDKDFIYNSLEKSNLFVLLSENEGFPYVILEAMAHGLPIITTRAGSIPEMLESKGGFFVKRNTEDLITGIKYLQQNYLLRKEMSEFNFMKVRKKYSSHVVVPLIENIVRERIRL